MYLLIEANLEQHKEALVSRVEEYLDELLKKLVFRSSPEINLRPLYTKGAQSDIY